MRESTKTSLLHWVWNTAALLCVVCVVIAHMPSLATRLTNQELFYGDLFTLSQVDAFKTSLPLVASQNATSIAEAQVITIGDSFFATDIGAPLFADMFEQRTGMPTAHIVQQQGYYTKPSQFFASHTTPAKILVWEQVERNIVFQYMASQPSAAKDIESLIPSRIRNSAVYQEYETLRDALFTVDPVLFFVTHSHFTQPVFEALATARFFLTGDISPRTPEYSKDPLLGFYDGELTYARMPLSDADVQKIADKITTEIRAVEQEYGVKVIYLPLPSKYTVYRHLLKNQEYNQLLPPLVEQLRQRGVTVVDMLPLYQQHVQNGGGWLYYPNDTHWTKKGKRMTVEEVKEVLENRQKLQ